MSIIKNILIKRFLKLLSFSFSEIQIDSAFQNLLFPLQLMQLATLNFKFAVRNHQIIPNSVVMNCITIAYTIIVIAYNSYHYNNNFCYGSSHWYSSVMCFGEWYNLFFFSVCAILFTIINIRTSSHHVILLAKIYNIFKFCDSKYNKRSLIITVWILLVIYSSRFLFGNILNILLSPYNLPPWIILLNLFTLNFDFTMIYFIFFVQMLKSSLEVLLNNIKNFRKSCDAQGLDFCHAELETFLKTYIHILEAYEMIKQIYQLQVSIKDFIGSWGYVGDGVELSTVVCGGW